MLTQTMTHAEVYAELERDRETATVWWRHHLDTLRLPVLKARRLLTGVAMAEHADHWVSTGAALHIKAELTGRAG